MRKKQKKNSLFEKNSKWLTQKSFFKIVNSQYVVVDLFSRSFSNAQILPFSDHDGFAMQRFYLFRQYIVVIGTCGNVPTTPSILTGAENTILNLMMVVTCSDNT